MDIKFKKTADKLSSKNIDTSVFEKQLLRYRKSMKLCLFEIHKARQEMKEAMKEAMKIQADSIREKIIEIKQSYKQIKQDLRLMFNEMNEQYKTFSGKIITH